MPRNYWGMATTSATQSCSINLLRLSLESARPTAEAVLLRRKDSAMKRSTDRILTSHAGSLHRPDDLRDTMAARKDGEPFDAALEQRVADAIKEVVRLQHENGVD